MAEKKKTIRVKEDLDLKEIVKFFKEEYEDRGFEVEATQTANSVKIELSKDSDGIKKFVGLALEITVNVKRKSPDELLVTFTDAEWVGKIIALGVGLFFCMIPFVIGAFGAYKQYDFPEKIFKEMKLQFSANTSDI